MNKIPKNLALQLGLGEYFTGETCVNGHVTYRNVHTDECFDCKLNSKTFSSEFEIQTATALRRSQDRTRKAYTLLQERMNKVQATYNEDLQNSELQYLNDIAIATKLLEHKRNVALSVAEKKRKHYAKEIKRYEQHQEYVRKAQVAREKLEAELKAKVTSKLPQSYKDLMK